MSLLIVIVIAFLTVNHVTARGMTSRRGDDPSLQSLMTLVQQQAASIQELDAKLQVLQNQQNADIQALHSQVSALHSTVSKNSAALTTVNSTLRTQVFFTAHMTAHIVPVTMGLNSPLVFNTIINNVGGGFNPVTGVFIAPVDGVYVFYVQLLKNANTATIHYEIAAKSGAYLCRNALDGNIYDKSSCLATVRLVKGDQVFVRRITDADADASGLTLQGDFWCSFSGFMVSQDV